MSTDVIIGFGNVEYETKEEAEKAIAANGSELKGRKMLIKKFVLRTGGHKGRGGFRGGHGRRGGFRGGRGGGRGGRGGGRGGFRGGRGGHGGKGGNKHED